MPADTENEWEQGRAAFEAGRYADAYEILRPLANAGHVKAQACLGSIVPLGLHQFPTIEAWQEWSEAASEAQMADFYAKHLGADRERALAWLRSASDAGDGGASHNLAITFVTGIVDEGSGERRGEALGLFAKARAQGFDCVDYGDPPGEDYLRALERQEALVRRYHERLRDEGRH